MKTERIGLCFHCKHRLGFLREGHAPRYECQQPLNEVSSCYIYKPMPLAVVRRAPGTPRYLPLGGPAFIAARMRIVREVEYQAIITEIPVKKKKAKEFVVWRSPKGGPR